jgi:hypothetical protein
VPRVLLAALLLAACASSPSGPAGGNPALTVLLSPAVPRPADTRAAIQRSLGRRFDLAFAEPPSVPPRRPDLAPIEESLAATRRAYIDADFGPCVARAGELARVSDLLAGGERALAARVLFWRVACRVGAGRADEARRDAALFAVLELDVPSDVEAVAPEVEALIAQTSRQVAAGPRAPLRVSAAPPAAHAVVSVDGRPGLCVAPCSVDVHPGDHAVRVEADGFTPEARLARVEEAGGAAAFTLAAADPALAAEQWTARHAASPAIDTSASVGLLAAALRARRIAVLTLEPAPKGQRLVGVLAVDGGVASRGERLAAAEAEVPAAAPPLLTDLLVRGRLLESGPPLHRRPVFWITVGLAAIAAATVTTLVLHEPEQRVMVRF